MITIKNRLAFEKMETAGKLLATMFAQLPLVIKEGVTTLDLNSWIEDYLKKNNLVSTMKGYNGYKHVSCLSINDEVVHGVPSSRVLIDGDVIKVDVCASWSGYCADMARPFFIGKPTPEAQRLIDVAQLSLDAGIAQVVVGNKLSNISVAIQQVVEQHNFGVVRDFAGHGIGRRMHEEPEILNFGIPNRGPVLRHGMSFALEPMITAGDYRVYVEADGWTVKTVDKSLAAHVEDTILVTDQGPRIITRLDV